MKVKAKMMKTIYEQKNRMNNKTKIKLIKWDR